MLQVVSDFTDGDVEDETLLAMMRASNRPLSISLLQAAPGSGYRSKLRLLEAAQAEGLTDAGPGGGAARSACWSACRAR